MLILCTFSDDVEDFVEFLGGGGSFVFNFEGGLYFPDESLSVFFDFFYVDVEVGELFGVYFEIIGNRGQIAFCIGSCFASLRRLVIVLLL